jgi:hypothetical protein
VQSLKFAVRAVDAEDGEIQTARPSAASPDGQGGPMTMFRGTRRFNLETLEDRAVPAVDLTGGGFHVDESLAAQVQQSNWTTAELEAAARAAAAQAEFDAEHPEHAFVRRLYSDLLGRGIDTGAQGYIDALDAGSTTRGDVAKAVLESSEYAARYIDGMFKAFLGRGADQPALDGYVDAFHNGASMEDLAAEIISSEEYRAQHAGPDGFIQGVYEDLLGRAPDEVGGPTYSERYASSDDARSIAREILESQENKQLTGENVVKLMLHVRPTDGKNKHVQSVLNGAPVKDVIAEIADSPTYSDIGRDATTFFGRQAP